MGKFKVGDRVRRVSGSCFGNEHGQGFVGTVASTDGAVLTFTNGHQGFADQYATENPSPVREVTRKEIVPDQYGIVSVKENHPRYENSVNVCIQPTHATAEQLRAAADVLTQLADALEPKP